MLRVAHLGEERKSEPSKLLVAFGEGTNTPSVPSLVRGVVVLVFAAVIRHALAVVDVVGVDEVENLLLHVVRQGEEGHGGGMVLVRRVESGEVGRRMGRKYRRRSEGGEG